MSFVHLQVYTAYSLLSSTISIPALIKKAKQLNFSAIAITDQHVLYGVLPFYKACVKAKIKPIIGLTIHVKQNEQSKAYPLVVLAKNNDGYQNLLLLSTKLKTRKEPTILWDELVVLKEGLIAITPGEDGEIEKLLINDREEEAIQRAEEYAQLFACDFYLSVQKKSQIEDLLFRRIRSLSERTKIPVVATNNVRYLEKQDAFILKCVEAIRDNKMISTDWQDEHEENYLKSEEEMNQLFFDWPEAIHNTVKIAEECNVMIETNRELLPKYPLPPGKEANTLLKNLCFAGLKEKVPNAKETYVKRLEYELTVIQNMGFSDYFLIVWDLMKYAREHGILTGPGRGSAAGSLVSYLLGITDVDPIKHGLLFERFLNPERITMPDIDIDFPDHRRDEVIHYVMNKYGKEHVAQIITFGTFQAKAALRDTARVFGLPTSEINQMSKLIPSRLGITLKEAWQESKEFQQFMSQSARYLTLLKTAMKIEGLPRHTSTHAAGVVISEQPLTNYIPLQGGENGTYLTQFPMEDLEEIGLLKMDFLGLRNLTILEQIIRSIELRTKRKINIKDIPFDDPKTFALLQRGDTTGIFQLESEGMRHVLRELKPTEFEDIVAVNALYRPGPMDHIPDFIARKHGKKIVEYPHPDLKPILEFTYGVIVYQEQIMQIAAKMAGFTLGEADLLRRAVTKKDRAILDKERQHFVQGAIEKGYEESVANEIYDLIVRFANYGFNRSHAVAYSCISWQLAWLKANYPEDFMAALLTSVIGNEEKIAMYVAEAKRKGITILPPSINESRYSFVVGKDGIRYSLAAIRGVGIAGVREILHARKKGRFEDLFDFCLRVSPKAINRKVLESLIHAGAMDEFGYDRAVLLATIDGALNHAEIMRPMLEGGDLFADDETIQVKPKYYVDVDPISILDKLYYEKEALGLYLSDHPTNVYEEQFRYVGTVPLLELKEGTRKVNVGVYLIEVKKIRTKKGELMAFVKMSDSSGDLDGVIFPDAFRRYGVLCQEGEILLISGKVERRKENLQFIIETIQSPKEIQLPKKQTLFIKIPTEIHEQHVLYQLHAIFQKYPGKTVVVLHYEATMQTIKVSKKNWVNPSQECLQEIQNLLGKENVVLK